VIITFSKPLQLRGKNKLDNYFSLKFGMKPYQVGKGNPSQTKTIVDMKKFNSLSKIDNEYEPLLSAKDVKRYRLSWEGEWIKYGKHLAEPRNAELFKGPRILIRRIVSGDRLDGTYTNESYICNTDIITLQYKETSFSLNMLYFLGILLSKPCARYLKSYNVNLDRATFPKINTKTLSSFPIPNLDLESPSQKSLHDRMVSLVEQMLSLYKQLHESKLPQQQTIIQRQIESTDSQIDQLVYKLYDLTEEEIKIIEADNK